MKSNVHACTLSPPNRLGAEPAAAAPVAAAPGSANPEPAAAGALPAPNPRAGALAGAAAPKPPSAGALPAAAAAGAPKPPSAGLLAGAAPPARPPNPPNPAAAFARVHACALRLHLFRRLGEAVAQPNYRAYPMSRSTKASEPKHMHRCRDAVPTMTPECDVCTRELQRLRPLLYLSFPWLHSAATHRRRQSRRGLGWPPPPPPALQTPAPTPRRQQQACRS